MSNPAKNSAEVLDIDPEKLWKKIGEPLVQLDAIESPEHVALRIIEKGILTKKELALLAVVAVNSLMITGGRA